MPIGIVYRQVVAELRSLRRRWLARQLGADSFALNEVVVPADVQSFRDHLSQKIDSADFTKFFPEQEWRRVSFAFSRAIPQSSVLEVGTGRGVLIQCLARSGKFSKVAGIDIKTYKFFDREQPSFEHHIMSVEKMSFRDQEFDTVFCMEVIEHLTDEQMERALGELRRTTKKRLIISVPFMEGRPLPSYHLQRFDFERARKLFPNARFYLARKPLRKKVPWLIIEENF